jgi:hypothetical protein
MWCDRVSAHMPTVYMYSVRTTTHYETILCLLASTAVNTCTRTCIAYCCLSTQLMLLPSLLLVHVLTRAASTCICSTTKYSSRYLIYTYMQTGIVLVLLFLESVVEHNSASQCFRPHACSYVSQCSAVIHNVLIQVVYCPAQSAVGCA